MKIKTCSRCKEKKPITEFHRSKGSYRKDGLQRYCKNCCNLAQLQWRQTHKELVRKYNQRHYQAHKEERKEISRQYNVTGRGKFSKLKGHARQPILFTVDEFCAWYNPQDKVCHYCKQTVINARWGRELNGMEIDRKDNTLPYTIDNICLCCRRCNTMKGAWLTEAQMLDAAQRYFEV